MNILVRLVVAIVIGLLVAWVANLVLNDVWSTLLGIVAGAWYFFAGPGFDRTV